VPGRKQDTSDCLSLKKRGENMVEEFFGMSNTPSWRVEVTGLLGQFKSSQSVPLTEVDLHRCLSKYLSLQHWNCEDPEVMALNRLITQLPQVKIEITITNNNIKLKEEK
jgi:hypothetical protein